MSRSEKIIAGCVQTIEKTGKDIFYSEITERTKIGTFVAYHNYKKDRQITATKGDIRYGCCDDVLIRGNNIYMVGESWVHVEENKTYSYSQVIEVKFDKGWKETVKKLLKKSNASFVLETL